MCVTLRASTRSAASKRVSLEISSTIELILGESGGGGAEEEEGVGVGSADRRVEVENLNRGVTVLFEDGDEGS